MVSPQLQVVLYPLIDYTSILYVYHTQEKFWILSPLSQLWGITLHVNCVGRALFNSNMFLDGCWWCQLHAGVVNLPPLRKLTLISTAVFLVFSICYVLNMGKPIEVDDFQLELIYWTILRSPPILWNPRISQVFNFAIHDKYLKSPWNHYYHLAISHMAMWNHPSIDDCRLPLICWGIYREYVLIYARFLKQIQMIITMIYIYIHSPLFSKLSGLSRL